MRRRHRRIRGRQFLEAVERMLDKGVVVQGEVMIRLPLLDLDVVDVQVHSFVRSCELYLVDAQIPEWEAEGVDAVDADEGARRLDLPNTHSAQ
jgi:hypothetical protein